MGRNNADFKNQILYHGSGHPFQVGDIVDASRSGGYAYSTTKPHEAAWYAALSSEGMHNELLDEDAQLPAERQEEYNAIRNRVFTVEPLEDDDSLDVYEAAGGGFNARSKKGFKITGVHGE